MSTYRLEALMAPKSIAVVGASPREHSLGRIALRNLRDAGFAGPIHLVNPRHAEIDGIKAVASLDAIATPPDMLVVTAPAAEVPGIIAAAGAKGAQAAVIISAGLGHGPGSLAEATRLAARAHGLRVLGPNGLGLIVPGVRLNASFARRMPLPGSLALISQSGAIAAGLVEWAAHHRVGFAAMASIGDAIDVDFGDLLDYFAIDRNTRAILMYVEFDPRCPQIHVGGPRGVAHQAGDRHQGRPPAPRRARRRDPHRGAGRVGCGLRRGVSPGRALTGVRPR